MKGHKMLFGKTTIFAGVVIGLCIGTVYKNYRAIELVNRCNLKPTNHKNPLETIGMLPTETIYNSQRSLVFVGVMTAKSFLDGRAMAVFDTWGKEVPGYMAFFSSEGSYSKHIPVIPLKNVDDRYPPQKKSFMMLYYMYEHFVDKFEWFIRADDDVYIDASKLERFLRSVDSSKPQFIGQAGKGNSEEFGLLSLEFDENFCMGGPGVILSRETLRRVAPHIPTCLKNLYSTHEDVEVGRCVQKFAGIPCTWNYEMQNILRHNSSGKNAFTGNLKRKEIHTAISLHPVKQAPLMYRLHSYIQGVKAEELRQESLHLHRDIIRMREFLQISKDRSYLVPGVTIFPREPTNALHFVDHELLGVYPDLNKFIPSRPFEILDWMFIDRYLYSAHHANPKRKIEQPIREGLNDAINDIMENINNFSRQRGRIIEFRELLYGYSRLNPLHGQDLILDLLLTYKKYRGKKMTVPVRRHIYVQRSFTGTFVREFSEDFYNITLQEDQNQLQMLSAKVKNIFNTGLEKISNSFTIPGFSPYQTVNESKSNIVFVMAISGRIDAYRRFLQNYEEVAINGDKNTDLLIVIFGEKSSLKFYITEIVDLRTRYPSQKINYIYMDQPFSRGIAMDTATRSSYIKDNDVIFFIDVDIIFKQESIDRVRLNTVQGKQVYLPIIFSEYDPSQRITFTNTSKSTTPINDGYRHRNELTNDSGYFRQFGYGICAIYKSDVIDPEINGFDKDINGWGLEDVKFLEKIIKFGNRPNTYLVNTSEVPNNLNEIANKFRRLSIFRSPDPSIVHVFHEINCDKNLEISQYNMCLGTKANTLGSTKLLESIFFNNKNMIDFIRKYNRKKLLSSSIRTL